jgi:hypothetical protein
MQKIDAILAKRYYGDDMDDPNGVKLIDETLKPAGTLASSVYQQLRSDILKGRLEPGSKLRLQYLAQQYNVGNFIA